MKKITTEIVHEFENLLIDWRYYDESARDTDDKDYDTWSEYQHRADRLKDALIMLAGECGFDTVEGMRQYIRRNIRRTYPNAR